MLMSGAIRLIHNGIILTPVLYTASLYKRTSLSIAFSRISKLKDKFIVRYTIMYELIYRYIMVYVIQLGDLHTLEDEVENHYQRKNT